MLRIRQDEVLFFWNYALLIVWRTLKGIVYSDILFSKSVDRTLGFLLILGFFAHFIANPFTARSLFRASVLALASVVIAQNSNIMMTILIVIAVLSSRGIEFDRIVRFSLSLCTALFVITTLLSLFGVIPNLALHSPGASRPQYCFGYTHFSAVPSLTLDIILMRIYGKKEILWRDLLAYGLVFLILFYVAEVTLNLILGAFLIFLCAIFKVWNFNLKSKPLRTTIFLCALAAPALMIGLSVAFRSLFSITSTVNQLLNNRIWFSYVGFRRYGLTLFGNYIPVSVNSNASAYYYIDIGYVYYLLNYGVIGFCVFVGSLFYILHESMIRNDKKILLWCIVILLESMIGRTYDSIWRNPLMFCAVSYMENASRLNADSTKKAPS